MQRPVMDPLFLSPQPVPRTRGIVWANVIAAGGTCFRYLLSRPFDRLCSVRAEPRSARRLAAGLLFRSLFLPIFPTVAAVALVYAGTHPAPPRAIRDPHSQGVYFEEMSVQSEDGTTINGWLIPAVDARRVVLQKDTFLRRRQPGLVLVHDYGQSPQQMLPLLEPLHDEGIVLLVPGLRGAGRILPAGQTFGLNESLDAAAAVAALRSRPGIDPNRIAVLGIGTGATAALLAAQRDPSLAALVLADPVQHASDELARRIGPKQSWMAWMRPIAQWEFDLAYHVDANDLDFSHFRYATITRPTLMLPAGAGADGLFDREVIAEVCNFCRDHLHSLEPVAAAQGRRE